MVDTLSGEYRPFLGYMRAALQRPTQIAGAEPDHGSLEAVVARMARVPPFADSASALALLRDLGLHVEVLTNSANAPAVAALAAAGLGAYVERVIASDAVRAYKPATHVYRMAEDHDATVPPLAGGLSGARTANVPQMDRLPVSDGDRVCLAR